MRSPMRELPSGTVTFLFTDIEGSTRLLEELGESYGEALTAHRAALRDAFATHGGVEVDNQGDAFFFAFPTAAGAVRAAADAQRSLAAQSWPDDQPVRVRMGIHTGEPDQRGSGYVGLDVHHAARIAAVGHGGQVVVSRSTRDLLGAVVPADGLAEDESMQLQHVAVHGSEPPEQIGGALDVREEQGDGAGREAACRGRRHVASPGGPDSYCCSGLSHDAIFSSAVRRSTRNVFGSARCRSRQPRSKPV